MVDDPLVESHLAWLSAQLTPAPLLVGYSGGLDSHVLLLWLARFVARHPEFSLQAVHVHHGLNPLADRLHQASAQVDAALAQVVAANAHDPAAIQRTARALAALKFLAESEVAPALKISIGFSDADGD